VHVCVCVCLYVCLYVCVCVCVYIYVCVYLSLLLHSPVRAGPALQLVLRSDSGSPPVPLLPLAVGPQAFCGPPLAPEVPLHGWWPACACVCVNMCVFLCRRLCVFATVVQFASTTEFWLTPSISSFQFTHALHLHLASDCCPLTKRASTMSCSAFSRSFSASCVCMRMCVNRHVCLRARVIPRII
jgi:hypothetical protein